MDNPLISILVPVYNSEKYLAQCLDSIINQKYKHLEIIVVDDGSTDKSGEICDEYADQNPRIKVFHQKNKGISTTRNILLSYATGDYIGFVDSDDTISPDMYSDMLYVAQTTGADMVVCNFTHTSNDGSPVDTEVCIPFNEGYVSAEKYIDKISGGNCGALSIVWNKLYKRYLFENITYPSGKIHEDDATIHKICHACNKIYYTPNIYYFYNSNPSSIMNKKFNIGRLDSTDAILDRIEFLKKYGYSEMTVHNCEVFLIDDFLYSIRKLDKKSKSDRTAIKNKLKLIKPYCKELLKSKHTDRKNKTVIRLLCFNPFIFFYI